MKDLNMKITIVRAVIAILIVSVSLVAIAKEEQITYRNYIHNLEDNNNRASLGYMLHRAWVQIFGKQDDKNKLSISSLDIELLAKQNFAVAWLGHDTLLIKTGNFWTLTDPILSRYATPFPPIGPKRLVDFPIDIKLLPHIDYVLISHDHYDHLDLNTVKDLANQNNGSPIFYVGKGLKKWFFEHVPNAKVEEMEWWESEKIDKLSFDFVPAQHSSGRCFFNKNSTLWGGWLIEYEKRKLYFAGDTAFKSQLFQDIKSYAGEIHFAALPVGAYLPQELMQYEHMSPEDAILAHSILKPNKSIAIHWGTFQLGDDTTDDVKKYFNSMHTNYSDESFNLPKIGEIVTIN